MWAWSPNHDGRDMMQACEIRMLGAGDVSRIAEIDRSEHVDVEYGVENGRLSPRPASFTMVPPWDPRGDGFHSVAAMIGFIEPLVAGGAALLGAFDGDELLGLAVVDDDFEPRMAWLALLHVSRPHRRRGVASALWETAASIARDAGATSIYVSATPTGSAVGFYSSRGCEPAKPVHPKLYELEPDDIHLVCALE
jgi:GNAT superfamily N-acetyltransferase